MTFVFILQAKAQAESFIYLEIDRMVIDSTNIQINVSLKNNSDKNIKIENPNLFKDTGFQGSQAWTLNIFDEGGNCYCTTLGFYGRRNYKKYDLILKKRTTLNFDFSINTKRLFFCNYESLDPIDIRNIVNQLKLNLSIKIDGERIKSSNINLF